MTFVHTERVERTRCESTTKSGEQCRDLGYFCDAIGQVACGRHRWLRTRRADVPEFVAVEDPAVTALREKIVRVRAEQEAIFRDRQMAKELAR